eukprot:TRINITY_DN5494_c0_g1_i5.p2 TRINITY_DN5494_c0_g1~~TRINITY_DN5494_c0_g1_i5.p2  ORF type:complete len:337 (-),score=55.88 TRINITY_DN5494_c0_g1_i5:892-1902(-)
MGNVALDPSSTLEAHAVWDISGICAVLVFLAAFNRRNKVVSHATDARNETAADYALILKGLPPETTDDDVIRYFQHADMQAYLENRSRHQLELVAGMCFACADQRELAENHRQQAGVRERANLDGLTDIRRAELHELKLKADELDAAQREAGCIGYGFVVLKSAVNAEKLLQWFNPDSFCEKLRRWCCCCCERPPDFCVIKLNKTVSIDIARAPEPSEINWETLSLTKWQRFRRLLVTHLLCCVVVGVALGVNASLKMWAREGRECAWSTGTCPDYSCGEKNDQRLKAAAVALLTTVLNAILQWFLTWITQAELAKSGTDQQVSAGIASRTCHRFR